MRHFLFSLGHKWLLTWVGSVGSAFGLFAMLCCFGWTGLASVLPLVGLGILVRFGVALWLIWIALGLTALGLGLSFRHHRRPWPLLTAALGAGLLLYPMYHALEVPVWLGMAYTGAGLLVTASGLDGWLAHQHARQCAIPPLISVRRQTRLWLISLFVSMVVFVFLLAGSGHGHPAPAEDQANDLVQFKLDVGYSWSVILLVSMPFLLVGLLASKLILAHNPYLVDRIRRQARTFVADRLSEPEFLSATATAASAFSGVVHLGLARLHFLESPASGVLFALSGLWQLLMGWLGYPLAARRRLYVQLAFNAGMMIVYVVSRLMALPGLTDSPESWDILGLFTKGSEILLIVCLMRLLGLGQPRTGGVWARKSYLHSFRLLLERSGTHMSKGKERSRV